MESLLVRYRLFVLAVKDAEKTEIVKKIWKAHDKVHDVLLEMIDEKVDIKLFDLYDDSEELVQLWAAKHTLEIDEKRALTKLDELRHSPRDTISSGAQFTQIGWENGTLSFRDL